MLVIFFCLKSGRLSVRIPVVHCTQDGAQILFFCPISGAGLLTEFVDFPFQRASAVAIGDGKTQLICLTHCDQPFALSTLRNALKPSIFSKWLEKIQLAEIEMVNCNYRKRLKFGLRSDLEKPHKS